MTNDTSTLNGALQELGETMAANLVTQGVQASASDGLTTLAGKILDIQGGGGSCYHIEFEQSSYTAIGSTVTVSVFLQSNYAPLSGASVTFTATGISQTATTDNNGIATTTISNVSTEFTLTATYQNVSDTATILPMVYLMNEDASTDNSSNVFGDSIALRNSGSNTADWNSGGYYTVKNTGSQKESMRVLKQLNGVTDDFCFEYDSYVEGTNGSSGFVIYNSSTSWEKLTDDSDSNKKYWYGYNNGSFHELDFYGNTVTNRKWVHYKYTIQGSTFTMEVTYDGNTVVTHSETIHLTRSSSTKYGLDSEWQINTQTRYKNLIAYTI